MRGKGVFTKTPTTLDRVYCCSDKTTKDGKVKSERCVLAKDNERNCNIKLSRRYSCPIQNNGVMPIVKETIAEGDRDDCKFMATGVREAMFSSAQRYRTKPSTRSLPADAEALPQAEASPMEESEALPQAEASPMEESEALPRAEEAKGGKTKRKRRSSRKTKAHRRQKK
jgi:hypothetical protein